jgi:hypothetical protein
MQGNRSKTNKIDSDIVIVSIVNHIFMIIRDQSDDVFYYWHKIGYDYYIDII